MDNKEISKAQALLNQNNEILEIVQSRCKKIFEDLQEDFECEAPLYNEDELVYIYNLLVYIYNASSEKIVFKEFWFDGLWHRIDCFKILLENGQPQDFIDRADEILEWLDEIERYIHKKEYNQYLEKNGYYD